MVSPYSDLSPALKAFSVVGGSVTYNDWLELTYGRRDPGVGVNELQAGDVCVYRGGLTRYAPGVKGAADPNFVRAE